VAGTGKAHLRDGNQVLRVEDLVMEFPVGRTGLKVNAVSGISLDVVRGETLVGVRQEHDRTGDHATPAADVGVGAVRGPGVDGVVGRIDARGAHEDADDLPGPDLVAQPPAQGP
jgi:hypothetical protein